MSWVIFTILSALFAAFTAVFAKIGIKGVDSNLATAIRTTIVLIFAWVIVLFQGHFKDLRLLTSHTLIFLFLSALTTAFSWIFYFRALQIGPASKVVPIDKLSLVFTFVLAFLVLGEKPSITNVLGAVIMTIGVILTTI